MSLGPALAGKILLVKQKGATVKANSTGVSYIGWRIPYNTAEYVALRKTLSLCKCMFSDHINVNVCSLQYE